MRHHFFGNVEERSPPRNLSGLDILQQVKEIDVTFGRTVELILKRKRKKGKCNPTTEKREHILQSSILGVQLVTS